MKLNENTIAERVIQFEQQADLVKDVVKRIDELFELMRQDQSFEADSTVADFCSCYAEIRQKFMQGEELLRCISEMYKITLNDWIPIGTKGVDVSSKFIV